MAGEKDISKENANNNQIKRPRYKGYSFNNHKLFYILRTWKRFFFKYTIMNQPLKNYILSPNCVYGWI